MQLQSPSNIEAEDSYSEAAQRYLQVLRQATYNVEKYQDHYQLFFPDIRNLQNEINLQQLRFHFYSALKLTKKSWIPKKNIENVIRACVNRQCEKSDITIDFYRHEGICAVIALYLATKDYNWVFAQLKALSEKWRKILIEKVKRIKVNDLISAWIGSCNRSPIREDEKLLRLNRYAKEQTEASRKRQRLRPAIFSNNQMPAALLQQYQTQPNISQADDIPPPAQKHPHDRKNGNRTQQTYDNNSRIRAQQHRCGPSQVTGYIQLPPLIAIQRHQYPSNSIYQKWHLLHHP
ncbi:hypothetical protein B0O99DRAFT_645274 [Bisporella sp. PMI_857]|nr:hypothetical protein B0O99DRAFT_645274 [Bisporella sp. PMI_857]